MSGPLSLAVGSSGTRPPPAATHTDANGGAEATASVADAVTRRPAAVQQLSGGGGGLMEYASLEAWADAEDEAESKSDKASSPPRTQILAPSLRTHAKTRSTCVARDPGWDRDEDYMLKYRTMPCEHGAKCPAIDRCLNQHPGQPLRRQPVLRTDEYEDEYPKFSYGPTRCQAPVDVCRYRARCCFAHSEDETLYHPHRYRTALCSESGDECRGLHCPYAHADEGGPRSSLGSMEDFGEFRAASSFSMQSLFDLVTRVRADLRTTVAEQSQTQRAVWREKEAYSKSSSDSYQRRKVLAPAVVPDVTTEAAIADATTRVMAAHEARDWSLCVSLFNALVRGVQEDAACPIDVGQVERTAFTTALRSCVQLRDLEQAKVLFDLIQSNLKPDGADAHHYDLMLSVCAKNKDEEHFRDLARYHPNRESVYAQAAELLLYARLDDVTTVGNILDRLHDDGATLTVRHLNPVLDMACASADSELVLHYLKRFGSAEADQWTANAIFRMLARQGYSIEALLEEFDAHLHFSPDETTFKSIITCLCKLGQERRVFHYYKLMADEGIELDSYSYDPLLQFFETADRAQAVTLFADLVTFQNARPNVSVISSYSFDHHYRILIAGATTPESARHQVQEYLALQSGQDPARLAYRSDRPNDVHYETILKAIFRRTDWHAEPAGQETIVAWVLELMQQMVDADVQTNDRHFTTILNLLLRLGEPGLQAAHTVWQNITHDRANYDPTQIGTVEGARRWNPVIAHPWVAYYSNCLVHDPAQYQGPSAELKLFLAELAEHKVPHSASFVIDLMHNHIWYKRFTDDRGPGAPALWQSLLRHHPAELASVLDSRDRALVHLNVAAEVVSKLTKSARHIQQKVADWKAEFGQPLESKAIMKLERKHAQWLQYMTANRALFEQIQKDCKTHFFPHVRDSDGHFNFQHKCANYHAVSGSSRAEALFLELRKISPCEASPGHVIEGLCKSLFLGRSSSDAAMGTLRRCESYFNIAVKSLLECPKQHEHRRARMLRRGGEALIQARLRLAESGSASPADSVTPLTWWHQLYTHLPRDRFVKQNVRSSYQTHLDIVERLATREWLRIRSSAGAPVGRDTALVTWVCKVRSLSTRLSVDHQVGQAPLYIAAVQRVAALATEEASARTLTGGPFLDELRLLVRAYALPAYLLKIFPPGHYELDDPWSTARLESTLAAAIAAGLRLKIDRRGQRRWVFRPKPAHAFDSPVDVLHTGGSSVREVQATLPKLFHATPAVLASPLGIDLPYEEYESVIGCLWRALQAAECRRLLEEISGIAETALRADHPAWVSEVSQLRSAWVRVIEDAPAAASAAAVEQAALRSRAAATVNSAFPNLPVYRLGVDLVLESPSRRETDGGYKTMELYRVRPTQIDLFSRQPIVAVFRVNERQWRTNGEKVAESMTRELTHMQRVHQSSLPRGQARWPTVPRLIGLLHGEPGFVAEYCEELDLHERLFVQSGDPLTTRQALQMALELARQIEHIHSLDIVHMDVKPSNAVLDLHQRVRICDFGCSRTVDQLETRVKRRATRRQAEIGQLWDLLDAIAAAVAANETADLLGLRLQLREAKSRIQPSEGTAQWRAPEQWRVWHFLTEEVMTKAVDVWSAGCVIYQILTRLPLWTSAVDAGLFSRESGGASGQDAGITVALFNDQLPFGDSGRYQNTLHCPWVPPATGPYATVLARVHQLCMSFLPGDRGNMSEVADVIEATLDALPNGDGEKSTPATTAVQVTVAPSAGRVEESLTPASPSAASTPAPGVASSSSPVASSSVSRESNSPAAVSSPDVDGWSEVRMKRKVKGKDAGRK